jgi:ABC-type transport system involved in Fe-S cluster assembly fused permease/ATPase subunit
VIFMIENGQCTARGTHEELLQSSPAYRTNVMHQMVADPDS